MKTPSDSIDWFQHGARPWFMAPFFRWSLGIFAACAIGILIFELLDFPVFKLVGWAHSYCYLRDPRMIALHVISDSLIGGAYVSISATLAYIVYKASKNIPFNWVFLAFGLFIVSCGFTHFMEIWVVWQPVYWLSGYVKVVTAAASVATAIALFPLVPKIFTLIDSAKKAEERRDEVERLNKELERFNYSVAHDLRAPLRGIVGMAHIIEEDFADKMNPELRSHLARINSSALKMTALLDDLLRYATLSRQRIDLRPVNSRECAAAALNLLRSELEARDAEVVLPDTMPVVMASDTLLTQVFQNLVGNGIKFVAAGVKPRVVIGYASVGTRVRFTVSDNGIGIPQEHRDRVFALFERLHTDYAGTGIGLPIVQRALERMGGEIGLQESEAGKGTVFWFTLQQG
jgi:signal transduction histidine kinase